MKKPGRPNLKRLGELVAAADPGAKDLAAFEQAARDAFRTETSAGLQPSRRVARTASTRPRAGRPASDPAIVGPAAPPPATADTALTPVASVPPASVSVRRDSSAAPGLAPVDTPSPVPVQSPWGQGPTTPSSGWVPVMGPEPAIDDAVGDEPGLESDTELQDTAARWPRRLPGDTAPYHLMRVPPSVGSTTSDFFDGLVRRVERDR